MRHVLEVVAALLGAGRATEVVERDRGIPPLREPKRELLVEAIEAADVGKDDDTDACRLLGRGDERREAVPVACLEDEVVVRDRGSGERRDRRRGVEVEAHERDDSAVVSPR